MDAERTVSQDRIVGDLFERWGAHVRRVLSAPRTPHDDAAASLPPRIDMAELHRRLDEVDANRQERTSHRVLTRRRVRLAGLAAGVALAIGLGLATWLRAPSVTGVSVPVLRGAYRTGDALTVSFELDRAAWVTIVHVDGRGRVSPVVEAAWREEGSHEEAFVLGAGAGHEAVLIAASRKRLLARDLQRSVTDVLPRIRGETAEERAEELARSVDALRGASAGAVGFLHED